MKEIILNPAYQNLERYVAQIHGSFERIGKIIQNNRNDVRIDIAGDVPVVVKSFKGMYLPNKIAYSLFRKSKALRSYEASVYLSEKGFLVPPPIASVNCYSAGFLTTSYFISSYYDHTSFNDMLKREACKRHLLASFAKFTHKLHSAGIYHKDYSNGNILCNTVNGEFTFALVDLNRVRFGDVNFGDAVRNFSTLAVSDDDLGFLIDEYARICGKSSDGWLNKIILQRQRRTRFAAWKRRAKAIFFPGRLKKEASAV